LVVCLLHDVLEDTDVTLDEMREEFSEKIIPLLKGLEKLGTVYYEGKERQVENWRKMFLAMATDIRVILIKLADRLHNIRTLQYIREDKRKRIAEETLSIYSPIAARLGIYRIKNELDDLCFKFRYPESYDELVADMKESIGKQQKHMKKSKRALLKALEKAGIDAQIEGRVKHLYSIHKKLKRKEKNYVSELYDIFALRIIVKDEAECYQALGVVHKNWTPLSYRFKDYIAKAKPNGYQSLHTTVIGLSKDLNNQPIEIQIRTKEMNLVAKYGIAAHWQYKDKGGYSIAVPEDKIEWVKNLASLHDNLKSNNEFIESLNVDIFNDRIFIKTPKGEVLDLPIQATPVDFAYGIHTEVGHKCRGAKVNGKIVPLDHKLKNGQVVEILTTKIAKPNRYWLSFVKTSHAKNSIKGWFNSQDRDNLVKIGKDHVNKYLKRFNKPPLGPDLALLKNYGDKKLSKKEREVLLEKIGNGSVDAISVIKKLLPTETIMKKASAKEISTKVLTEGIKLDSTKEEVLISGEKGYKTQIATCCKPNTQNQIIGYITRGRGVTIHQKNCKVLRGHEKNRLIKASWSMHKQPEYEVTLSITRQSRIGMLRDITTIFAEAQLAILDFKNDKEENATLIMTSLDSLETLDMIIQKLETIPGVYAVKEVD